MSLTGNLEDLPLLDIIQIVSFSKKTGYLSIHVDDQTGAIVFRDGLVVCAFNWDTPQLDRRADGLPAATRNELLRTRIEIALEQLVRLREGQFGFNLTERPPETVASRPVARETLSDGINAQELLLNLARGIDEDRRDSSEAIAASFADPRAGFDDDSEAPAAAAAETPEPAARPASDTVAVPPIRTAPVVAPPGERADAPASAAAPARALPLHEPSEETAPVLRLQTERPEPAVEHETAQPPAAARPKIPRRVLLVDDEDDLRQMLALRFAEAGYNVEEADGPEEALKLAGQLSKSGVEFVLVSDLNMPASGGASFQGGFEVVKRLWKMKLHPPVVLMTETLSGAVRARARQMGIEHVKLKPGLSRLDAAQFERDMSAFADGLAGEVLPELISAADTAHVPQAAPGARPAAMPAPPDELSRQFRLLQQRLDDLRRSGDAARIAVLVMKVAREFFERSLLLLVKNEELRGLGGFGPAPRGMHLNLLAREIAIPLQEPSVFLDVITSRRPWSGLPPEGRWSGYVLQRIGRFHSNGIALIPLLTHRQTTAVLFGDNPETGRAFRRLEALEVFVDQAGVTLENVFLQRKVQALQAASSDKIG